MRWGLLAKPFQGSEIYSLTPETPCKEGVQETFSSVIIIIFKRSGAHVSVRNISLQKNIIFTACSCLLPATTTRHRHPKDAQQPVECKQKSPPTHLLPPESHRQHSVQRLGRMRVALGSMAKAAKWHLPGHGFSK